MSGSGTDFDDVKVKGVDNGGTDREIAALWDDPYYRLAVENKYSPDQHDSPFPCLTKKARFIDMNVASGGVARSTYFQTSDGWVDIFSYSGSGIFLGFLVSAEDLSGFSVRLIIDSEDIFDTNGINIGDVINGSLYSYPDKGPWGLGIRRDGNSFHYGGDFSRAICYATSAVIKLKRTGGGDRRFYAGLVNLTKET